MTRDLAFDREAYISLADEFDPMGGDPDLAFDPADWDPLYVEGATAFAERYGIPLPWTIRSLDVALEHVKRADYNEREDARITAEVEKAIPWWPY